MTDDLVRQVIQGWLEDRAAFGIHPSRSPEVITGLLFALSERGLRVLPEEMTEEMVECSRWGDGDFARMMARETWKAGVAAFEPSQLEALEINEASRAEHRRRKPETTTPAERAAAKVLRDPANSKRAKTARGEALTQRSKEAGLQPGWLDQEIKGAQRCRHCYGTGVKP